MRLFYLAGVLLLAGACSQPQGPAAQVVGTWRLDRVEVYMTTALARPADTLTATPPEFGLKLGLLAQETEYTPQGRFQDRYQRLDGTWYRGPRGRYEVLPDRLILQEEHPGNERLVYHWERLGRQLYLHGRTDWDRDGTPDDSLRLWLMPAE